MRFSTKPKDRFLLKHQFTWDFSLGVKKQHIIISVDQLCTSRASAMQPSSEKKLFSFIVNVSRCPSINWCSYLFFGRKTDRSDEERHR